jgi:hypothetical protein
MVCRYKSLLERLKIRIICCVKDPDPGSGAFLTPGSGIRDPKPIFFESLVKIFWVKISIIL